MAGLREFFKPLICEKGGESLSLGRVGFWIVFAVCLWHWTWLRQDVPEHLWLTLGVFLAYNFGKKTRLANGPGKEDGA